MKYMKPQEFACKCCGVYGTQQSVMERFDEAREIAGVPFVVTSGYRCEKKQEAIGSKSSVHPDGWAADISAPDSRTRFRIVDALMQVGFNRIGIGKDFVHGDLDPSKAEFVIWTYYGK